MKAIATKLLDFLKQSPQFVIPIYQRTYSWSQPQCQKLWDDIIRAGTHEGISAHFIGSVVYIDQGLYQVSRQASLLVIDGQQRLTSISLLLEALARVLTDKAPVEGFFPEKIRNQYLLNPYEEGEQRFKLLLTQTDKESLLCLLTQKSLPEDNSLYIRENFEFFQRKLNEISDELEIICRGLSKLLVVDIALTRDQDNPQLIFESMNSTGKALSQADLIRNYILMDLDHKTQTQLYQDHWRPMERAFGQEGYDVYFDGFMRHYLTVKTGEIPRLDDIYDKFKQYAQPNNPKKQYIETLLADIHDFADYYCAMALGKEKNADLANVFQDLRELKVDVVYPLLLKLYQDYRTNLLSFDDFKAAVRLIESYIFRRSACSIPANSLNKLFATFYRSLKQDRYLESLQAYFLNLSGNRRLPTNDEFYREIQQRDLYRFHNRSYWLRKIENYNRKERVMVDEYTIEHILPQNPKLSSAWKQSLGENWQEIQNKWLHTLGNLTLTGYNSEYSDNSFAEKRDMVGGFKQSPLKLNQGIGEQTTWNESTIRARAEKLAAMAMEIWSIPCLSDDIQQAYKTPQKLSTGYTLDNHPQLNEGSNSRLLFDTLRAQIKLLDKNVTEEVLKLYIAYKAETNFVDIIPQKSRLLLILNIRFHEIDDPRNIARDVSNIGRWGNGEVEVILSKIENIPYIMGLIKQSFEKQLVIA